MCEHLKGIRLCNFEAKFYCVPHKVTGSQNALEYISLIKTTTAAHLLSKQSVFLIVKMI